MTGINHRGQVENRPAVTRHAVGVQFMLVGLQPRDAAEVDHGLRVESRLARGMTLVTD